MKPNKLRILFGLNRQTAALLAEAFVCLGWARMLVAVPFARIAPMLGSPTEETPFESNEEDVRMLRRIHDVIQMASRHTPWESRCLVCAIAAMNMLKRRRIGSTLYLGTARDGDTGGMIAHAWLRSGPFTITGAEGMERFTAVGRFAQPMRK